jgi:hypothetical protein
MCKDFPNLFRRNKQPDASTLRRGTSREVVFLASITHDCREGVVITDFFDHFAEGANNGQQLFRNAKFDEASAITGRLRICPKGTGMPRASVKRSEISESEASETIAKAKAIRFDCL